MSKSTNHGLVEGALLFSSCAGAHFGRVLRVGKDDNGVDVIDVEVFDANEAVHFELKCKEFPAVRPRVELPEGVNMILRDGYKWAANSLLVGTPVGGCFRCSQLFSVHAPGTEVTR